MTNRMYKLDVFDIQSILLNKAIIMSFTKTIILFAIFAIANGRTLKYTTPTIHNNCGHPVTGVKLINPQFTDKYAPDFECDFSGNEHIVLTPGSNSIDKWARGVSIVAFPDLKSGDILNLNDQNPFGVTLGESCYTDGVMMQTVDIAYTNEMYLCSTASSEPSPSPESSPSPSSEYSIVSVVNNCPGDIHVYQLPLIDDLYDCDYVLDPYNSTVGSSMDLVMDSAHPDLNVYLIAYLSIDNLLTSDGHQFNSTLPHALSESCNIDFGGFVTFTDISTVPDGKLFMCSV